MDIGTLPATSGPGQRPFSGLPSSPLSLEGRGFGGGVSDVDIALLQHIQSFDILPVNDTIKL